MSIGLREAGGELAMAGDAAGRFYSLRRRKRLGGEATGKGRRGNHQTEEREKMAKRPERAIASRAEEVLKALDMWSVPLTRGPLSNRKGLSWPL